MSRSDVRQAQLVASESAAQSTALFWLGFWADLHRHLLQCTAHLLPVCHTRSWQYQVLARLVKHRRFALHTPLQCASSVCHSPYVVSSVHDQQQQEWDSVTGLASCSDRYVCRHWPWHSISSFCCAACTQYRVVELKTPRLRCKVHRQPVLCKQSLGEVTIACICRFANKALCLEDYSKVPKKKPPRPAEPHLHCGQHYCVMHNKIFAAVAGRCLRSFTSLASQAAAFHVAMMAGHDADNHCASLLSLLTSFVSFAAQKVTEHHEQACRELLMSCFQCRLHRSVPGTLSNSDCCMSISFVHYCNV